MDLHIPTEPIGSIPRPRSLIEEIRRAGDGSSPALEPFYERALRDTLHAFEETGSPVLSDGEQNKFHDFWTYSVHGLPNIAPDGFELKYASGHVRRMPRLTFGPFHYQRYADSFVDYAMSRTHLPVKQAVISPSALSLLYPAHGIPGYSREAFLDDLAREHATEVRRCLASGAHSVQIDFTEARYALKIDPTGELLAKFVELNNRALAPLSSLECARIGVHTCAGGDCNSTHSADVAYDDLLPALFSLKVRNFYVALAGEPDRLVVLGLIRKHLKPGQRVFVGVTSPVDARVETAAEVCERVLEAARYIPLDQLGTTDDCGFSPFYDDVSTSREVAFAKIRARVAGTALAEKLLDKSQGQRH